MINEKKFPFKWMRKAIDYFEKNDKPTTSFQLARKIGSCGLDAGEVAKMLAYLTQFGRVVSNSEKWKFEPITMNKDHAPKGFRVHYIHELSILLQCLSEKSVELEEIAIQTKMKESDVYYNLNFLRSITKKGQIYLHRNKFPQQWGFKSWEARLLTSED